MFCTKCGSEISDSAVFCPQCGEPVAAAPAATVVAPRRSVNKKKRACLFLILSALAAAIAVCIILFSQRVESYTGKGIYGTPESTIEVRDNYTVLRGRNRDVATVMVYMVGSDLESESGLATADIEEMLWASSSGKLNIVIQTGGCSNWQNDTMESAQSVSRWLISDGEITLLEEVGSGSMLTSASLGDFISFANEAYPADRYDLILWDHGGGSLYGFGYDELHTNDVLLLSEISDALKTAGVKFDFVGFDACLMGSLETAYMLEPYADYLIASEEYEPGEGWYYTDWLEWFGSNTSCATLDLGAKIVDSYISKSSTTDTLSVIELRYITAVYRELNSFFSTTNSSLDLTSFAALSSSRAEAKRFAEDDYDMIDLYDFTVKAGGDTAGLLSALETAVKYRNDCDIESIWGLSIYFPYNAIDEYDDAKTVFAQFNYGDNITVFFDRFVNELAHAKLASNSGSFSSLHMKKASGDYSEYSWYSNDTLGSYTELNYESLQLVWSDSLEHYTLPLTDEDWSLISSVQLQALYDDGEGYIDLGSDQVFELDDNDNLVLSFDNTWVALDGQVVPYYSIDVTEIAGEMRFTGYVPALLNEETEIRIILMWDKAEADAGYVAGYQLIDDVNTAGKGYKQFIEGDAITVLCDYYNYDGTFDDQYVFGDKIIVGSEPLSVTYEDVGSAPVVLCYQIIDIYQNYSWTEMIEFSN